MKKYVLLFICLLLPIVLVGLYGMWLIAPVGLLFLHAAELPLSAETFQQQLNALAMVSIAEKTEKAKDAATIPATITFTIPAEALNVLLYQGLTAKPGKFITVDRVNVDISAETIYAVCDVHYGLPGLPKLAAIVYSEWKVKNSANAGTVEIKPIELHSNRLYSVNLAEWWAKFEKKEASGGWMPLSLVTPLQIQDIMLEEDALVLLIASK